MRRRLATLAPALAAAALVAGCAGTGTATGRPATATPDPLRASIQRFPAPGACHARGSGLEVLPDPHCTPGATDPRITQQTIARTICRSGWTKRVRPPTSVTEPEKRAAVAAYGDYAGSRIGAYELDHLIPLELGGAANAAANLWPERDAPGAGFTGNPKDRVENRLHARVCDGQLTLARAQAAIATDWVAAAATLGP